MVELKNFDPNLIPKDPKPYLDTNVILDYIRKRKVESITLMDTILKKRIKCFTSYYTIYELLERGQENKWIWKRVQDNGETLDDIIRSRYPRGLEEDELKSVFKQVEKKFLVPFVKPDIVDTVIPFTESWDNILKLMQQHNLSVGDAFHVDAALGSHCGVFITRDDKLEEILKELRVIPVVSPKDLEGRLHDLGLKEIQINQENKKPKSHNSPSRSEVLDLGARNIAESHVSHEG